MANQQVIVSILADTRKLKSGMQEANAQLGTLNGTLQKAGSALKAFATGFVITKGVNMLRDAITEAEDAEKALARANTVFGDTPGLLSDISKQADNIAIAPGKDNDIILDLASTIGSALSPEAKKLSADLVNVGADAAVVAKVDLETWTKKFQKQMVDGSLSIKEMRTSFKDLSDETYINAEALFKAGDQAGALQVLMEASQKAYGDAAENQVTATERIKTLMDQLSESIGKKLLPHLENFANFLRDAFTWAKENADTLKTLAVIIGSVTAAIIIQNVAMKAWNIISGLYKVATGQATLAQLGFNAALLANPIVLIVALIAGLVAGLIYFFTQTKLGKEVWANFTKWLGEAFENIKKWFADLPKNIKSFIKNAATWLKDTGKNIIDGLLSGLKGAVGGVMKFFTDTGKNIEKAWKNFWGIKSPSRKMAEIGRQLNAGLAVGLEDTRKIEAAMTTVNDSLMLPSNTSISGNAGIATMSSANTYNITVQAVAPNAEVGRAVVTAITEFERTSGRRF